MRTRSPSSAVLVVAALAATAPGQQVQFLPFATRAPQSFLPEVGPVLGGFAGADVDADGLVDLAVVENFGGRLWRNSPTGYTSMPFASTFSRQRPVLVDLDNDGDRDLVLVPGAANAPRPLTVLRLDPTAIVAVPLPTQLATQNLQGVAVGDLDGDALPDLVLTTVAGSGLPPLVVLRNLGGMQFALSPSSPTGLSYGLWPSLADAENDGDLDVFASSAAGPFVLLRNSAGTLTNASSALPTTRIGHTVSLAGDFDGDGFADLAATWWNGDLDLVWGSATGYLLQPAALPLYGATLLQAADFDADGDRDLLAARQPKLELLRNGGGRQFAAEVVLDGPPSAFGVVDANADGRDDILVTATAQPAFVRWIAGGVVAASDAGFELGFRVPPTATRQFCPLAGDVDGDGRTDLLVPSAQGLIVDHARGDGAYTMTVSPQPATLGNAGEVDQLLDLDGDGDLDLVAATTQGLSVYGNDGTGAFALLQSVPLSGGDVDNLRAADVDGDGDLDLALAHSTGVALLRNLGGGLLAAPVTVVTATGVLAVEFADLDGDGDLDLVSGAASGTGAGNVLLANDGTGAFASSATFSADLGINPLSIASGDFDGDGDRDLVAAGTPLRLLANSGAGTFVDVTTAQLPSPPLTASVSSNVVAADFDEDGDLDLFAVLTSGVSSYYENDGTGHFLNLTISRFQIGSLTGFGWQAKAVDFDDDGDLDLLVGGTPFFGASQNQFVVANHLRQLRSTAVPRLAGAVQLDVFSGPGFGPSGIAIVGMAFAQSPQPFALPGFLGDVQLDATTLQVVATVPTSAVGVSNVILPVPAQQSLVGLRVWFQAAVFGTRTGVTNAVYEVVQN